MKKLQIAVGIIRNENNEIFITRRAADAHMANKLEFPGGKIEMGETPEQAVVRELQEEVGITPQHFSLFEKLEYEFPDRHITLWFWLVESWEGEPAMTTGEKIKRIRQHRGMTQKELGDAVGLTANRIAQYEMGYRVPKAALLEKMAGTAGEL